MDEILDSLQRIEGWKQVMRYSCRRNHLNTSLASDLTILKIKSLYERFKRNYEHSKHKNQTSWIQNQLKAFYWILLVVSSLANREIQAFQYDQWKIISDIFGKKPIVFLKFEAKKLLNEKNKKNKVWVNEQEQLFRSLVNKNEGEEIRWNEIAHQLFQLSEQKYFKTGKQCRQKWFNHLDPNKIHGSWTDFQNLTILKIVDQEGKKWSKIVKELMGTRTEHMVKNRFNSLIIKQKKIHPGVTKQSRLISLAKQEILRSQIQNETQRQQNPIFTYEQQVNAHKEPNISQPQQLNQIENKSKDQQSERLCVKQKGSLENESISAYPVMGIEASMYHLIREDEDQDNRIQQQIFTPTLVFSPSPTYYPSPPPTGFVFSSSLFFHSNANNNNNSSFQNYMNLFMNPRNIE